MKQFIFLSMLILSTGCGFLKWQDSEVLLHNGVPVLYTLGWDNRWVTSYTPSIEGCYLYVINECPDVFVERSKDVYKYHSLCRETSCGQRTDCSFNYCEQHIAADTGALGLVNRPDPLFFKQRWEIWLEQNALSVVQSEVTLNESGSLTKLLPSGQRTLLSLEKSSVQASAKATGVPYPLFLSDPKNITSYSYMEGSEDFRSLERAERPIVPIELKERDDGWRDYLKIMYSDVSDEEFADSLSRYTNAVNGLIAIYRKAQLGGALYIEPRLAEQENIKRRMNRKKLLAKLNVINRARGDCNKNTKLDDKQACFARLEQVKNKIVVNYLEYPYRQKIDAVAGQCNHIADNQNEANKYSCPEVEARVQVIEKLMANARASWTNMQGIQMKIEDMEKKDDSHFKARYESQ